MNATILNTIDQYVSQFMETVAEKFEIPVDQLEEIWKQTIKTKPKRGRQRRRQHKKSAYVLFCADHRPQLKAQNMKFGEISQRLGQMWREVTADVKSHYENLSNETAMAVTTTTTDTTRRPTHCETDSNQEEDYRRQTETDDEERPQPPPPKKKKPAKKAAKKKVAKKKPAKKAAKKK